MNSDSAAFLISSIAGFAESDFKAGKSQLAFLLSISFSLSSLKKSTLRKIVESTLAR